MRETMGDGMSWAMGVGAILLLISLFDVKVL